MTEWDKHFYLPSHPLVTTLYVQYNGTYGISGLFARSIVDE